MRCLQRGFIKRHSGPSHLRHPSTDPHRPEPPALPIAVGNSKQVTTSQTHLHPSSTDHRELQRVSRLHRQARHDGFAQPPPLQVHRSNPIRKTKRLLDQCFSDSSIPRAGRISSPALIETASTDRPTPLTVKHPH